MSKGWEGGSTRRWRKTRALVLVRDGYRCQLRLPGCTTHATHVHHVAGKQFGDDPALLVASCQHCNLVTGDPTKLSDPKNEAVTKW
jgi:5-methylcytosine-specific restriction endonuclease McrA